MSYALEIRRPVRNEVTASRLFHGTEHVLTRVNVRQIEAIKAIERLWLHGKTP